ncbi:MAG: phosphatidate cytidylyltransferase [candidate division WOR-3 bacterium]
MNIRGGKENLGGFFLRIITGLVLFFIVLLLTLLGTLPLFFLIFIFLLFALWEYLRILYNTGFIINPHLIFIVDLIFFPFIIFFPPIRLSLLMLMIVIFFFLSFLSAEKRKGFNFLASSIVSIFYLVIPSTLFYQIRTLFGLKHIIFLLGCVIFFDSFSYFAGNLFGKRKIWERISQNKTIEGFLGGFLSVLIFSIIFSFFFRENTLKNIIPGIFISFFAFFGDLWESMLKREMGVKDSSNILPGHGGFLDRIDSLLLSIYFYFLYIANIV